MNKLALILILFVQTTIIGQSIPFKKGVVLDSIPVKNAVEESFALYLPTTFNAEVNSAIIFIFDPSGSAKNGINVFKIAAEKFNYILVCSNNTKNGPYQRNFDITNRLFNHIFSEFKIDAKRIYTAGFSGGSRLACAVAVLSGAIQGVIACGAGFPEDLDKIPTFESKFSYVGLVGDEDMNFQEMHQVQNWLDRVRINNTLYTNNDDHRWPDEIEIDRALSWIELQAFKTGIKPINNEIINFFYKRDYDIAKSFNKEGNIYQAAIELDRIYKVYSNFINLDSINQKVLTLKDTDSYRNQLIRVKNVESKEHELSEKFITRFRSESIIGKSDDNYYWWKNEWEILNNEIEYNKNILLKKMYLRLRYQLFAMAYENSMIYQNNNNWISALYCDRLLVVLHPDEPYWYFRVALSYANNNQFNPTLKNLEKAMSLGFKRKDLIKSTPIFQKYNSKKKFKAFLESIDN